MMKKNFKRIIVWILISLLAQVSVLFYAENVLFADASDKVEMKKLEKVQDKKEEIAIDIPSEAKEVKVSFNGKYISYIKDSQIHIVSTNDGSTKTVKCDGSDPYYMWLSDRNRMIIGEKESGSGTIKLFYYDGNRDEKEHYNDISTGDSKAKITDIQASTLTQVTYVKVSFSQTRSTLYRIGINNDLTKPKLKTSRIGDYYTLNREDVLIYKDTVSNNIYSTKNQALNIKGAGFTHILGVDSEDTIYIADGDENKAKTIYYGTIDTPIVSWKKEELKGPTNFKDIYISNKGGLYVNDNLRGAIMNIKDGTEVSYEGKFLSFYEGAVASIKDGKLKHTELK